MVISEFVDEIILHWVARTRVEEDKVCCTLSNLKCYLHKTLINNWNQKDLGCIKLHGSAKQSYHVHLLTSSWELPPHGHFRCSTLDTKLIEWIAREDICINYEIFTILTVGFVGILAKPFTTSWLTLQVVKLTYKTMTYYFRCSSSINHLACTNLHFGLLDLPS